ncbi:MAG: ABC transporter ATP-binding protein, partial [Oscillospiraceae bacterium]|nr:ABC transporter ATP-binding protein [Oscillospiraceae bacterium]
KVPRDQRAKQVNDAMERLHITDVQKRIIGNLSKGYRQRVGFAQALLGSPKFLILDEPTVGLDPKQVMEVRRLIKDLAKDHTIIFSTHILAEVTAGCERVVIISQGKIRAVDTIENLENSIGGEKQLRLKIEGEITKVTDTINNVAGVTGISEVEYESDGVSSFTVSVTSEEVRKPLMAALIAADCMVLEVTSVHANLEDVFVRLTAPSREDALADLNKELDAAREAEKAAKDAAETESGAESEKEGDD